MKSVLTKCFVLILVISVLTACTTTAVSAEDMNYQPQNFLEEAIAQAESAAGESIATNRIYFQMPRLDSWYSEYGVYQDRYYAGIYWWSGSVIPQSYPGYRASVDHYDQGVYYADVPADVINVIWNNGFFAEQSENPDVFDQHCQTVDINIEDAYAGDYDTLPEGSPNQNNMDGCIFIVDPDPEIITSQYIPKRPYAGNWYVYYGNGCYGSYATTSENFISSDANCLNPDHFDENGNHIGGDHIKASVAFVYGDADCDGSVSILDATVIQRILVDMNWESFNLKAADVNGDGLDITDATLIQRFLAGMIASFPIENIDPANSRDEISKVKDDISIEFTDNKNWGTVYAYLFNKATGEELTEMPGVLMSDSGVNDKGETVYSMDVDVSKYDRVVFNNGGSKKTTETPITKASNGYHILGKSGRKWLAGIYPYHDIGTGTLETVYMDYPDYTDGTKKAVFVWLPEGYDASDSSKKYSVLYMCDGQALFGNYASLSGYDWLCDETIKSLMNNGGDGIIIVGISSLEGERDVELTPDIGEVLIDPSVTSQMTDEEIAKYRESIHLNGKTFSDFVVDTVMPYIESNYNTNSIRGVAGSSNGGLEAFYIGIEHPNKFRYIGALSPAFVMFSTEVWDNYLNAKNFSGDVPPVYIYTGNNKSDTIERMIYPNACAMENLMTDCGYPSEKITTVIDPDGTHSEGFWSLYFPDMLSRGLGL